MYSQNLVHIFQAVSHLRYNITSLGNIRVTTYIFANQTASYSYSDLAVEFLTPVTTAGAWVGKFLTGASAPSSIEFNVYDTQDVLISQTVVPTPSFGESVFIGFHWESGFDRLEWKGGNSGWNAHN